MRTLAGVCGIDGQHYDWSISVLFLRQDADDLPFKKGEILDVLTKDEEQWWTARNALGMTGQIPVPYVQKSIQPPAISVSRVATGIRLLIIIISI